MSVLKSILTPVFCLALTPVFGQSNDSLEAKIQVKMDPNLAQYLERYNEQNAQNKFIEGYRVQIYNGNKNVTNQKKSEFRSYFPNVATHIVYETPEYKLQVGDFRTRLEAQKFLNSVYSQMQIGFVVKTKIEIPKI